MINTVSQPILNTLFAYYIHKTVSREEALSAIVIFKKQEVYLLRKYRHQLDQYKVILPEAVLEKKVWVLFIRSEMNKGKTSGDIAVDLRMTLASVNKYLI